MKLDVKPGRRRVGKAGEDVVEKPGWRGFPGFTTRDAGADAEKTEPFGPTNFPTLTQLKARPVSR